MRFVITKSDITNDNAIAQLKIMLDEKGFSHLPIITSHHGQLDIIALDTPAKTATISTDSAPQMIYSILQDATLNADYAGKDHLRQQRQQQGYQSIGWVFNAKTRFDYARLTEQLNRLNVPRLKAIMHTNNGIYRFNHSDDVRCS